MQIIATKLIKRNYVLFEKNILLDKINDTIDFLFTKNNKIKFIKVIINENNQCVSFGKNIIKDMDSYILNIKNIISEKDLNKEVTFDVILIEFKPKNKPQITILNNEKIY